MAVIEGLDELQVKFKALDIVVRGKVLMDAAAAGAELIRAQASVLAPRRTGALASHIGTRKKTSQSNAGVAVIDIGPEKKQFYGYFVERGTKRISRRQPFLQPAFDEKQEQAIVIASAQLKKAIDSI